MITRFLVFWPPVGNDLPATPRPASREVDTHEDAVRYVAGASAPGWKAQIMQATAPSIAEIDALRAELIALGWW